MRTNGELHALTKGGKYREVPITSTEQRSLLAEAMQLAGKGGLIPSQLRYRDQLQRFKVQCAKPASIACMACSINTRKPVTSNCPAGKARRQVGRRQSN